MSVRGLLYDLDGVLIDSVQAWYRVIQRGARELGHGEVSWAHFRRTFGQGVEADRLEFFPSLRAVELERFYERAFGEEVSRVELLPGALEALLEGRRRGLRQAVVTNTPLPLARRVLDATGLAPWFEAVAAAGEAEEKPSPALVYLALERLGLRANEVLYIGDSPTDLGAARAAGVRFAGLGLAGGDLTLRSLDELWAAL